MAMMKFADGLKEIKVGQKCITTNGQIRTSGSTHTMVVVVESIGRKYVTMTNGYKFDLETGRKKTEYTWGELYSSREEYDKVVSFNILKDDVRETLDFYLNRGSRKLPYSEPSIKFLNELKKVVREFETYVDN